MQRSDPLLYAIDLPLTGSYYPAGFRLDIATNSRDVLEAAAESWGRYAQEFECQPLQFRIVIQAHGELAPRPVYRKQRHLWSVVSDRDNHAGGDSETLFASFFLSEKTARDHAWLRWFFVEAMAYALLSQRYVAPIHAACVARQGAGILLCGESGAGKSTLSFACARAGWTFVADDGTLLLIHSEDRMAVGTPHKARFRDDAPSIFPELAGYAVIARPNGKLSLEVPLDAFPQIRTASRCPIRAMAFLNRRTGERPRVERLRTGEAVDRLLRELPVYGPEVDALHEKAVRRLEGLPAWSLHYESLGDALGLLSEIMTDIGSRKVASHE